MQVVGIVLLWDDTLTLVTNVIFLFLVSQAVAVLEDGYVGA